MLLRLRIELIILAIAFIAYIFISVNRKKLLMSHSVIWILIAIAIFLVALFPGAIIRLSAVFGIEAPSNLIYLLGIFALLVICFSLTARLSQQTSKVTRLIQMMSIEKFLREEENNCK